MKQHKTLKITLLTLVAIIALSAIAFIIYASDYYHADDVAVAVLSRNNGIEVVDNLTIISPSTPSDVGLIFYPGAKVEHTVYLPILNKLRQNGITCVLIKMPFNFAFFDANAADRVYEILPNIKKWYIGGHSLGGAMASSYASNNPDKVAGLILLGAYIYGDYPPQKSLTIYGTFNSNLEKDINYTQNIVVIDGGNHAQFGNYGKQSGDPDATISTEEQQDMAVNAIIDFINSSN